ncbi:MAG: response regulator [Pseudomonadota bacterium]
MSVSPTPEERLAVLLVDDDPEIRSLVSDYLTEHGIEALTAADGVAMHRVLKQRSVDLILLDVMLPGDDGLTLCREVRERAPVILLTALAEESDRVLGLEIGADDYLTKPFSNRELLARIRAVLRRGSAHLPVHRHTPGESYRFEGWELAPLRRELRDPAGTLVSLTGGEFDLLLAFVRNAGRVLDRDELLELTKGRRAQAFDRAVDVQLSRLRKKLGAGDWIRTVRGGGYLFAAVVDHG